MTNEAALLYFFVGFGLFCVWDWVKSRLTPRH